MGAGPERERVLRLPLSRPDSGSVWSISRPLYQRLEEAGDPAVIKTKAGAGDAGDCGKGQRRPGEI